MKKNERREYLIGTILEMLVERSFFSSHIKVYCTFAENMKFVNSTGHIYRSYSGVLSYKTPNGVKVQFEAYPYSDYSSMMSKNEFKRAIKAAVKEHNKGVEFFLENL